VVAVQVRKRGFTRPLLAVQVLAQRISLRGCRHRATSGWRTPSRGMHGSSCPSSDHPPRPRRQQPHLLERVGRSAISRACPRQTQPRVGAAQVRPNARGAEVESRGIRPWSGPGKRVPTTAPFASAIAQPTRAKLAGLAFPPLEASVVRVGCRWRACGALASRSGRAPGARPAGLRRGARSWGPPACPLQISWSAAMARGPHCARRAGRSVQVRLRDPPPALQVVYWPVLSRRCGRPLACSRAGTGLGFMGEVGHGEPCR
jgi:hypothetical protein